MIFFFFLEMANLKSFTSFSSTTCCRVKISWPRSHSVQLTYSFYKREDIHFIILCPRHWSESTGCSWWDCAKVHRDHPFSVILELPVLIPKAHWLGPSALLPTMLYFKAHFSPFFNHEVFFFFFFFSPNHLQNQFLSFHPILFVVYLAKSLPLYATCL